MSKTAAPMFYGYIMEPDWLYEYGIENHCVPPPEPDNTLLPDSRIDFRDCTVWNAKRHILSRVGLGHNAKFLPFIVGGEYRHCLVLTTNDPKTQAHMPLLPIERYARLMKVIEVDEEPMWWEVG